MSVYIILFNANTANEGVHSLRVEERELVLMFEAEEDATRFGLMLEAQDFPPCKPEGFPQEEIEGFCDKAGYEAILVPGGHLLVPPERNVEKTTWKPDELGQKVPSSREDEDLNFFRQQLEKLL